MPKTVLITGASRGIGREIARLFAVNGYNVAINFLKSQHLAEELVDSLARDGFSVMCVPGDVSDYSQVQAMVATVNERFGDIHVLVNNAGIALQKLMTDTSLDEWLRVFSVNVTGTFHCCKAVVPSMVRARYGKIVNISSVWGITGASCEVAYSSSKAAIIGFTKALAKELGPSTINVNCVAPGVISTDMNSMLSLDDIASLSSSTPLGSVGSPADVAHTVLFLASDTSGFITGQVICTDGGFAL